MAKKMVKKCSNCDYDPKISEYDKICNHPSGEVPEDDKNGTCKGWKGDSKGNHPLILGDNIYYIV